MINFWQKLPKPFLALAPMDDVTDLSFREMLTVLPRPDVFFTEFTNADGLIYNQTGVVAKKLGFTEKQRPIVAQIWGTNLINLEAAAKMIQDLGFDGIDINMGCPKRTVVKKGAGAGLITNPSFAVEIIESVKRGAPNLPISVKTRLGANFEALLKTKLAALIIHGRTTAQKSKGKANWDEIGKVVLLRDKIAPDTIIVGNGDILNYKQALEMREKYNVDGVMIGRGIFKNPFAFSKTSFDKKLSKQERIDMVIAHMEIFLQTWGEKKDFNILKKFFKMYIKGFLGANQLRQKLMESKNSEEALVWLRG